MARKHDANAQTKLDMKHARARSSIDIDLVRSFIFNGREKWEVHKRIVQIMSNDSAFDKAERLYMTRTERYKRALAMTNRVHELKQEHRWTAEETNLGVALIDEQIPINLHEIAFEPVFWSQGSPELIAKYGELVANRGILGCYLQTELAHGTNVNRLETTATYVPETREFEIHSPTLTSSKWWVGALAKTATHGVVQAKLVLPGGKDMGPHLFFVQLRSLDDHRPLPRIILGDIGPKAMAGYASTDNGYARFDRLRVPRENMLSKFAHVTEDGLYVKPPHSKLSYGGMVYIRANMITRSAWFIAKAATVSIRYATVRRQGNEDSQGLEQQVISYPSVHYRLLPILSHAYVFIILGRNLSKAFDTMSTKLASGDTSLLADMHAITSGLKVLSTTVGIQDLEVARRSMGGHGFSAYAGLGRLYADYLPVVTFEGDNFVLDQQVVRAAVKAYHKLFSDPRSASPPSTSSQYLRLLTGPGAVPPTSSKTSWDDSKAAVLLLEWRAARMVQDRSTRKTDLDASIDQRVSKAVSEAFVATHVSLMLDGLKLPSKESRVISDLFRLYLLTTVEASLVDLLSFGLYATSPADGADPTKELRVAIAQLCQDLLPEAVGLTDAFGFTDWELDSALGVYDGNVYEILWDKVQTEPLNKTEVPSGYEEYIKPMIKRGHDLARSKSKL